MKTSVVRTTVIASVVTALLVSVLAVYGLPRLMNPQSPTDGLLQPAVYNGTTGTTSQPLGDDTVVAQPRTARRTAAPVTSYRQPVRQTYVAAPKHRSTAKSALIVAGSAGTGAAIGALAGGGKGAGIGAIAGGVGGLIYDRMTANKH